jgi:hypothetical protein
MINRVLAIYYSQTGQLEDIVNSFCAPFIEAGVQVEKVSVKPKHEYPFPWTSDNFFDEMPESVLGVPTQLQPITLKETSYDLIIFAYQPWFLSPSIPANSILVHPAFQAVVRNTPVITLIGARNMWLNAQVRVVKSIAVAGGRLVGNVALVDRNGNLVSAVSILYWMLTGKKDRYLNLFPKPGISDADISNAGTFGKIVLDLAGEGDWEAIQPSLVRHKAVEVFPDLMFIEARAKKLFLIWARIIIKKKNRHPWVVLFKYYLLIALFVAAPLVLSVNNLLFRPFVRKRINQKKQYYLELK